MTAPVEDPVVKSLNEQVDELLNGVADLVAPLSDGTVPTDAMVIRGVGLALIVEAQGDAAWLPALTATMMLRLWRLAEAQCDAVG